MDQPCPGDPSMTEVQSCQLAKPLQIRQPGVGDVHSMDFEFFELTQSAEMCQARIGNPHPDQFQELKSRKSLEMHHPCTGQFLAIVPSPRSTDDQPFKSPEVLQVDQSGIAHPRIE